MANRIANYSGKSGRKLLQIIEFGPRPNLESEITQIAPRRHYYNNDYYYL